MSIISSKLSITIFAISILPLSCIIHSGDAAAAASPPFPINAKDFCQTSINNKYCIATVKSLDDKSRASLTGMGKAFLKISQSALDSALKVLNDVKDNKAVGKSKWKTCTTEMDDANGSLVNCLRYLKHIKKAGMIDNLRSEASAAFTDITTCDDTIGKKEPKVLKNATLYAMMPVDLVMIVANKL